MPRSSEVLANGEMVRRLTVTLDDELYAILEKIATEEERTVANLLAYLGRERAKEWEQQGGSKEKR